MGQTQYFLLNTETNTGAVVGGTTTQTTQHFEKIEGKAKTVRLSYWQANGLGDGGKVTEIADSETLVSEMMALVEKMADHFAKPGTAYPALPWPAHGPYFNDYAHLERVAEWSTAGGGDE